MAEEALYAQLLDSAEMQPVLLQKDMAQLEHYSVQLALPLGAPRRLDRRRGSLTPPPYHSPQQPVD